MSKTGFHFSPNKVSPQYTNSNEVIKDIFLPSCGVKKGKLLVIKQKLAQ